MKYLTFAAILLLGCENQAAESSKTIRQLIFQLETSRCVIVGGAGFGGEDNPPADAYKSLLRIAPDSVWVRLSYSEKPTAGLYAYQALLFKKSRDLQSVINRLRTDSALVCEIYDDVSISASISQLVSGRKP